MKVVLSFPCVALLLIILPACAGTAPGDGAHDPRDGRPPVAPATNITDEDFTSEYADRLTVILMGDPQLPMVAGTPENVRRAMEDIAAIKHDFLVVLGDLVQPTGDRKERDSRYGQFTELILSPAAKPVFPITGNADFGMGLHHYHRITGLPDHYIVERRGIRFIFLGTTKMSGHGRHICHIGEKGMALLRQELKKDRRSTTILFHHAPVRNTTIMSGTNARRSERPVHKPRDMFLFESDDVVNLMRANRNIKVFANGHVHCRYGDKDTHGREAYCVKHGVLFVSVGAAANAQGSSMLEIRRTSITVKVRDHADKRWDPNFERTVRVRTTLTRK